MQARIPLATFSPGYRPPHPSAYVPAPPRSHRRLLVWLGALALAALIHFGVPAFFNWKHTISSSGGRYFLHPVLIHVPAFQQNDPRWNFDLLGPTIETMGQAGCAVTSAAMVLADYGVDIDPQRLNNYLTTHGGYTPDGSIYWERAADLGLGQVEKAYEDAPSYNLIDENLLHRNPVIVRLTLRNGRTHFVVIVGKKGWDYLTQDPARSPGVGPYPLRLLTGRIEALRYYKLVPPPLIPVPVIAAATTGLQLKNQVTQVQAAAKPTVPTGAVLSR